MFGNIRGLLPLNNSTKVQYISDLIKSENLFMICLTESHLNPMIANSEIQINDWDIIRADRMGRIGGGVICYLRKDVTPTYVKSFCNSYCESTVFYVPEVNMACITVYRPPKCPLNLRR